MRYVGRILSLLFLVCALAVAAAAQDLPARGDDSNRPSKNGMTTGTIGDVGIVIQYGRPNVKGREIWGGLVPYGEVWRTGANEATLIRFSRDVKVEGRPLPAGAYSLYTIPGETEWTVILNKQIGQWGTQYDESQDALRVQVKPQKHDPVESLDFVVEEGQVIVRWEKLAIPFRVEPAS